MGLKSEETLCAGFGGAVGVTKGLVSIGILLVDLLEGRFRGGFGGAVGVTNGFVSTGGSRGSNVFGAMFGLRGGLGGVVDPADVVVVEVTSDVGFESGGGREVRAGLGGG